MSAAECAPSNATLVPPPRYAYYVATYSTFLCAATSMLLAFVAAQPCFARLRVRRLVIVEGYALGVGFMMTSFFLPVIAGPSAVWYPCWLSKLMMLVVCPTLGAAAFVRNAVYLFTTRLSRASAIHGRVYDIYGMAADDDGEEEDGEEDVGGGGGEDPAESALRRTQVAVAAVPAAPAADDVERAADAPNPAASPPPKPRAPSARTKPRRSLAPEWLTMPFVATWYSVTTVFDSDMRSLDAMTPAQARGTMRVLRYITRASGMGMVMTGLTMPFAIANLSYVLTVPGAFCLGCMPLEDPVILWVSVAEVLLTMVFSASMSCRLRGLPDPWGIFFESYTATRFMAVAAVGAITMALAPRVPDAVPLDYTVMIAVGALGALAMMTGAQVAISVRLWARALALSGGAGGSEAAADALGAGASPPSPGRPLRLTMSASPLRTSKSRGAGAGASSSHHSGEYSGEAESPPSAADVAGSKRGLPAKRASKQAAAVDAGMRPVGDIRGAPHLASFLRNLDERRAFEAHLEAEWGAESLGFLTDTWAWKTSFSEIDARARVARARKIIRAYVRDHGVLSVNVSSAVQSRILAVAETADADPQAMRVEVFDEARHEVAHLLEVGAVARFMRARARARTATAVPAPTASGAPGAWWSWRAWVAA